MMVGRASAAVVVVAWALFDVFWRLFAQPPGGDESTYVAAGWQYVHGDFALNREHPPTAKYLFGLAQLVAGQGVDGPRVVVGLLVLACGVVLFCWLRPLVGYWGALAAAAMWWLTPRGGIEVRVDREAVLDPVMSVFALFATAAAWRWSSGRGGRSVAWAAASGALLALSVTSKVSTAVLVPVLLVVPVVLLLVDRRQQRGSSRRRMRRVVLGVAAWLVSFAVVFVVVYAPMGMRSAIAYMVRFQGEQNAIGHRVVIAGRSFARAPWWADFVFAWEGLQGVTVVVLLIGVVAAFVAARSNRRPVLLVSVALAVLVVFYVGVARVALPTYYVAWVPFLVVLAAVGFAALARGSRAVATLLVLCLVVPAAGLSIAVAHDGEPGGTRHAADAQNRPSLTVTPRR
jgi:hypothetical protein